MATTLLGRGAMPLVETVWPRNSMLDSHFSALAVRRAAVSRLTVSGPLWSSMLLLNTRMLYMYGEAFSTPLSMQSMSRWKVLPTLRLPKVMQVNSNSRKGVVMAVFGMSAVFIGTWWYPFFRFIFEK